MHSAQAILDRLDLQLHHSQRNLRLYFAIGGGLLGLGLVSAISLPGALDGLSNSTLGFATFLVGSALGFYCGTVLQRLALPGAVRHVEALLLDGLLLVQLLDSPEASVPGRTLRRGVISAVQQRARDSMAGRLDWIVNNWSIIIHQLGYRPLPPRLSRLHIIYLALVVGVPLAAVLTHNALLLLALGSVYVLGLALDALECDAVRQVLLDALRR